MGIFHQLYSRLVRKGLKRSPTAFLRTTLRSDQWQAIDRTCQDPRLLLHTAATILSVSEELLVEKLAEEVGLPYTREVTDPISVADLPVPLEMLQARAALLAGRNGQVTSIICVEPELLGDLQQTYPDAELVLTLWPTLLSSYERLEQEHEKYLSDMQMRKSEQEEAACERALELLIDQAQQYQACSLTLSFASQAPGYQFETPQGKIATGKVHADLHDPLFAYLHHARFAQGYQINTATVQRTVRTSLGPEREVVEISWNEAPSTHCADLPQPSHADATEPFHTPQKIEKQREILLSGNHLIVVIDDSKAYEKVLARFFTREEISTVCFSSAREALEQLTSGNLNPSLIISDVHMPDMNGFELVKELRNHSQFLHTPLVMLTSDDQVETELELIASGADAFVSKNEDPRLLTTRVLRLLQRYQEAA